MIYVPHVAIEKSNRRLLPDNSKCLISVNHYTVAIIFIIAVIIAQQFKKIDN